MNATAPATELKFIGDLSSRARVLSGLKHACRPDPIYPQGIVCSIYFDTLRHHAYEEKANGDYMKTKTRLRWYEPVSGARPNRITAFLEAKRKTGGTRAKDRVRLECDRSDIDREDLDGDFLSNVPAPFLGKGERKTCRPLFPSIRIDYLRRRFVCPASGARVSLDQDIVCRAVNRTLLPSAQSAKLRAVVVEIKDAAIEEIPWANALAEAGMRLRSFSKYGTCFECILGGSPHE